MAKEYDHKPSKSKYLKNLITPKKYNVPLKRSLSGYEIEYTVIDSKGDVVLDASKILKKLQKDNFSIVEEAGKNMLEINALPHTAIQKTGLYLINSAQKIIEACQEQDCFILPLGTYPGTFKAKIQKKERYRYISAALGKEKFDYYGTHTFGFHYHYTMPRGVFNPETKFLNQKTYSKTKQTLIDSYNFLTAADPVLTTFAQSSPFDSGKYYAKDTRLLFWRGGKKLKYDGMFAGQQMLGGLPPYYQTVSDLISGLKKRDVRFKKLLRRTEAPESFIKQKEKLDYIWNPVKINKVGTIEHRSMDTNYLEICLGVSVMMKFILRAIQQEFYHVIPSDIGAEEPFKLEGNVIFIPPQTLVRDKWQKWSIYDGFANNDIYEASKRLYNLADKLVFKKYKPALKPIKEMLEKRRTVSDMIINYTKSKGHSLDQKLPKELARQISLMHAERMVKNLEKTKKVYENLV